MFKSTAKHSKYWRGRRIDWKTSYFDTLNHPHRGLLSFILKSINFFSLWEVGVGGGANIARFVQDLPGRQYGGSDVNADAIKFCSDTFKGGLFHVESGNDMMMSDKSVDVILSDATLIYVSPFDIDSYLKEFKRVGRNNLVLCEFHSNSFLKRLKLYLKAGYFAHNYRKKLEKQGFFDIMIQKIPKEIWPGTPWEEWGYIITARIP